MCSGPLGGWGLSPSKGLRDEEKELIWRQGIVRQLNEFQLESHHQEARKNVIAALENPFLGSSSPLVKLVHLTVSAAKGTVGVQGHLLGSLAREYPTEAAFLWAVLGSFPPKEKK